MDEEDKASAEKLVKQCFPGRSDYNGLWYLDGQVLPERVQLELLDSKQIDLTELNIAKILSIEIQSDGKGKVNPKWANNLLPNGKDKRQVIRDASYAALIYTDFRCGLVHWHEGKNGVTSSPDYPGKRDAPIYESQPTPPTNEFIEKFANQYNYSYDAVRTAFTEMKRRLYFPYEYIRDLMMEASNHAFDDWERWAEPSSYEKIDTWAEKETQTWWITKYKKRPENA